MVKLINILEKQKLNPELKYRLELGKHVDFGDKKKGKKRYELNYKDGKLDGKHIIDILKEKKLTKGKHFQYYKNRQIKVEFNYKEDGKLDGKCIYYFESGLISDEAQYIMGKKNGIRISYFPTGKIYNEANYSDGKKNGKETQYRNQDYTLLSETWWYKGKRNGPDRMYNRNGNISSEENYRDGILHGKDIEYYQNGDVRVIRTFKNGEQIGAKCY